ncbi:MAG TPA: ethanolamine ammonia-lyase subunit EutC [Anaerolineae bacterium]|nr:ethanolamine ammonia-lyase subunit EutC [Anaerolineae bacterium]
MNQAQIDALIDAVVEELKRQGIGSTRATTQRAASDASLDLPDITTNEQRTRAYIKNPLKPDVLRALMATTPARIGIGHAGPRYRNIPQFIFWADHAVTQDALFKEIDPTLLQQFNLFQVQTQASSRQEYLLRPDLGRKLSDAARKTLQERCIKQPDVQIYVADGLSAAAIEHNLRDIFPVLQQGLQQAGLKLGTPFYVKYGRVGLLNDVNSVVDAKVVVTLIGERPGLGRAEAMSAYMGYRPQPDSTDADRDVVCNIFNGGTNPLEAGAYVVEYIKRMIKHQASGIKLKLLEQEKNK